MEPPSPQLVDPGRPRIAVRAGECVTRDLGRIETHRGCPLLVITCADTEWVAGLSAWLEVAANVDPQFGTPGCV